MGTTATTVSILLVLGGVTQPKEAQSDPVVRPKSNLMPRTVTKEVAVTKQVMVTQKKLVAVCVRVCPPGFRRPYYELRYVEVEEQTAMTVIEKVTVAEKVAWQNPVNRYVTIANLPPLSRGSIEEVHKKLREIMSSKQMLSPGGRSGDPDPDYKGNKGEIVSDWFEYPRGSGREYKLHLLAVIVSGQPATNELNIELGVLKRNKGEVVSIDGDEVKLEDLPAVTPLLTELFASPPFPYPVRK